MKRNWLYPSMIGIICAVIVGGGVLTSCQGGLDSTGIGDGPVMLYFYATW